MNESQKAITFLKENKKKLIDRFAPIERYPSAENPFSIFMAGSPGAGKTEMSKGLIESGLIQQIVGFESFGEIVRIDDDEIRKFFKDIGYDGTNTDVFKSASNLGVEKVFDSALKNNQNLILDATFSNYEKSRENVKRSLNKNRNIGIFYIYLDPIVAWNFTQKRSKTEGRTIPREFFVESFFDAKENVNRVKEEFSKNIELTLIQRLYRKDSRNFDVEISLNVENIDNYLKLKYNKKSLISKLC